ncbi:hypothetical protein B6U91_01290 [Candidatus Pacearchaeota archaeon ex4484_71]|nr:MAG: hypothetical protein B6U91_01290 [Candidatus Pacearchaeota archaeon ex4484_71]
MEFNEYQKKAWGTAVYPNKGNNVIYPMLGLGGEAGEVLEKMKKILRDFNGEISDQKKEEMKKELGDVLWYLATISTELGLDFEDVVQTNIKKLASRKEREVIHGEGDNR